MSKIAPIFFLLLLFSACAKKSEDAATAFKLWSLSEPKGIKVNHGQYWRSAHFTLEYIVYLDLKASKNWIKNFKSQNNLQLETSKKIILPEDAPDWFEPKIGFTTYTRKDRQGSLYFFNEETDEVLLYEIQL